MINELKLSSYPLDHISRKKNSITNFYLGFMWSISAIIFAIVQVYLGTDLVIITFAFLSLICCVVPIFIFGIYDIEAMFIFILLAKYSFIPVWVKTVLGERIDIGLRDPFLTYEIILVGSVISCLVLLLVKSIPLKKRILDIHLNRNQLIFSGYCASIFGLVFLTLHVIFTPVFLTSGEMIGGFGGFGSLDGPLYFGVCCHSAICFTKKTHPVHKLFLLFVFLVILILSVQTNGKTEFSLAVFVFVLTFIYFQIKISAKYFLGLCVFLLFYFMVFAPAIHVTRTDSFKLADIPGKIGILEEMFSTFSLQEINGQSDEIFNYAYYPSIHSFFIDRVEMVQDLDIAAGGISQKNTIGWIPVQWSIDAILPGFINPNKSKVSDIDLIAYVAGYYPILTTINHTIGVFGSAYAMFLWPGMALISLAILFLYLLILRTLVPSKLLYNAFGIFFLGRYVFTFSEQSVQGLLSTILRSIPLDALLILAIVLLTKHLIPTVRKMTAR